jgi:hypothetical protein
MFMLATATAAGLVTRSSKQLKTRRVFKLHTFVGDWMSVVEKEREREKGKPTKVEMRRFWKAACTYKKLK